MIRAPFVPSFGVLNKDIPEEKGQKGPTVEPSEFLIGAFGVCYELFEPKAPNPQPPDAKSYKTRKYHMREFQNPKFTNGTPNPLVYRV